MKFQSIVASVLTIACSFCVLTSRAAADSINISKFEGFTSGAPENVGGSLSMDKKFDVGNKKLILTGIAGITGSYAFTGDKGGIVDLEFASDVSMSGSANFFTGGIQLVVRGEGYKIRLPKTSSHTGGTVVCGGVVDGVTGSTRTLNSMKPFGAAGSVLEIRGGTVLSHAYNTWQGNYSILLNGGCLKNNNDYSGSNVFDASIEVKDNSTIEAENAIPFKPESISGTGKLTLTGEGGFTIKKDISMPETSLAVATSFALGSYNLDVGDYEVTAETAPTGTGMIKVNGTFKPTTANFSSVVLLNGSTIDLTGWEDKAVVNADGDQVAFAEAATITLDVGDRVVADGDVVLVWADGTATSSYEGRLFKLVGKNVASGLAVEATAEGVKAVQASQDIVTATWKGEGEVSNWKDPANWICYNAADAIIPNGVPGDDLTVVFTGDVSDVLFGNGFPFAGARLTDANLSANVDWSAFDLGLITSDSVLDIGENALKITKESGITSCAATFTSTAEDGVFEIEVADGASFTNATINLSGKISLKKTGFGTLVLTKEGQTYAGKTIVEAGTLVCGTLNVTNAKTFGEGKEIDLANGAILDPAGAIYWNDVVIKMNGGKIVNTVERTGLSSDKYNATIGNPFNPTVNLNTSSILETSESFNFQGKVIAVNDSELTIDIPVGKEFLWDASNAKDFKLNVTGGGFFKVWYKPTKNYADVGGPILDMKNASFNLQFTTGSGTKYPATFGVKDYIASSGTGTHMNGGTLEVYRTFVPVNDYFFGCKMMNGSTIDLSGKDGAWGTTSKATGKNTIEFEEGANITIALGDRVPDKGAQIMSWTEETKPAENVEFRFHVNRGEPEELILSATGIFYGRAKAPEAVWTGTADNDLSNPDNWEGDQLGENIRATFKGNVANLTASDKFVCGSILFDKATIESNATLTWLDLNKVTEDSVLDLKGNTLELTVSGGECESKGKITDTVGGGVLNLTVTDGVYTNKTFSLGGGLSFVKKGEGTYVAAKVQDYTGETKIEEGLVVTGQGNEGVATENTLFGKGYKLVISEKGILDAAGSYGWVGYTIDMDGGTITNTIDRTGYADGKPAANRNMETSFAPTLYLSQDARIITTNDFNFCGTVLANDHELEVNIGYGKYFVWNPQSATNLTLNVSKGGYFCTTKEEIVYATQTNMIFKCNAALDLLAYSGVGGMSVRDYYASYSDATNEGAGSLKVYGTFYPVDEKYFRGCVMMDGSTIDLSKKTKVWSITSSSNHGNNAPNTVTFADDATVTIDVHGRSFGGKNKQIISWTEETKPADRVTFVIDAASKAAGYKLEKKDDGIWAKHPGLVLILN